MFWSALSCSDVSGGVSGVRHWVPERISHPLLDDVVDARGDDIVVAQHRGDRAPLTHLGVESVTGDAAVIEVGITLDHPFGVMTAVRTAHHERAGGASPVMGHQNLFRVESELSDTLARFVVAILWPVGNREAIPTLIAGGEGVALLERCSLEGSGGEFRSRKSPREDGKFSIPVIGQRYLEFRVVGDDSVEYRWGTGVATCSSVSIVAGIAAAETVAHSINSREDTTAIRRREVVACMSFPGVNDANILPCSNNARVKCRKLCRHAQLCDH